MIYFIIFVMHFVRFYFLNKIFWRVGISLQIKQLIQIQINFAC